jgi:hypothetical protein
MTRPYFTNAQLERAKNHLMANGDAAFVEFLLEGGIYIQLRSLVPHPVALTIEGEDAQNGSMISASTEAVMGMRLALLEDTTRIDDPQLLRLQDARETAIANLRAAASAGDIEAAREAAKVIDAVEKEAAPLFAANEAAQLPDDAPGSIHMLEPGETLQTRRRPGKPRRVTL